MAQPMGSVAQLGAFVAEMRRLGMTRFRGPLDGEQVEIELAAEVAAPVEPRRKTADELADEQRRERERVRDVTRGATARIA